MSSSQNHAFNHPDFTAAQMPHHVNPLRALQSQDSLGREWEAALAGDDGMINLLQRQAGDTPGVFDFLRSSNQSSSQQTQVSSGSGSGGSFNFDNPFDSSQPTLPTMFSDPPFSLPANLNPSPPLQMQHQHISPAQLTMNLDHSRSVPNPYPPPISTTPGQHSPLNYPQPIQGRHVPSPADLIRPTSASSYNTSVSVSGSECSYSATDISEGEDYEMGGKEHGDGLSGVELGRMALQGEKTWTQYDQDGAKERRTGPVRTGKKGEEDKERKDRLEHRRSINRKSAQKHRARRKEELEILSLTIAEKDAKISQLERDLAVERAKSAQLMEFLKDGQGLRIGSQEDKKEGLRGGGVKGDILVEGEKSLGKGQQAVERTRRSKKGKDGVPVFGDGRDAGW